MVKCCAPLCGNASNTCAPNITFHQFPKDAKLKVAWLNNMGRKNWQPKPSNVLCSQHFEAHLVDRSGFRVVLATGAVPTIFDLSFQDENIPSTSHKGPVKRSARGDKLIMKELQNIKDSTPLPGPPGPSKPSFVKDQGCDIQSPQKMLTAHIENNQACSSSGTVALKNIPQMYIENKYEKEMKKLKSKNLLKNKKSKP